MPEVVNEIHRVMFVDDVEGATGDMDSKVYFPCVLPDREENDREIGVGLTLLVIKGALFTHLDLGLTVENPMPVMNSRIEGGGNV